MTTRGPCREVYLNQSRPRGPHGHDKIVSLDPQKPQARLGATGDCITACGAALAAVGEPVPSPPAMLAMSPAGSGARVNDVGPNLHV